jgi:hypothetical protein
MAATYFTNPKRDDRLAQLWEELRTDPVPLQPAGKHPRTLAAPVLVSLDEPFSFPAVDKPEGEIRSWRVDLAKLFHSLLEPEVPAPAEVPVVEAIAEGEALPATMAAAHEASLSLSTPFHWEPKPAWTSGPARATAAFTNTSHPPRFAAKPKIPIRPLHKQPFYKRFLFYLRRWLIRDSGKPA